MKITHLLMGLLLVGCSSTNIYNPPPDGAKSDDVPNPIPAPNEISRVGDSGATGKGDVQIDPPTKEDDSGSPSDPEDSGSLVDSGVESGVDAGDSGQPDAGGYAPGTKCERTAITDSYCSGFHTDDYTCTTTVGPHLLGQANACQGQGGTPEHWKPGAYHFCCK